MRNIVSNIKGIRPVIQWMYIPAFILLLAAAAISYKFKIPISMFTRDPLAIVNGHPFYGMISNIGVLFWCASAAVCFFSYALLQRIENRPEILWFIFFGAIITSVLLLDDLFSLHEQIFPTYFFIREEITVSFYGILLLFYFTKFRKIILETNFFLLFLALLFFGISVLVDCIPHYLLPWHPLFEDGPKFLGIIGWFSYFTTVCFREVKLEIHVNSS